MTNPHYTIGIDLGTTNSVVAYLDNWHSATSELPEIRTFQIPQVIAKGEIGTHPTLPSFLYFPTTDELSSGAMKLPWEDNSSSVVGLLAREEGALSLGRQVSSAKSWLSCASVNRRASILPWKAQPPQPVISPVAASACYLRHLRDAWNYVMLKDWSGDRTEVLFQNQEIVLTVPASFDEEARELTVEAAREAGLEKLTLLEEPLAAFYAWIAMRGDSETRELQDGHLVLICDIGGGTTDFSLIRVSRQNSKIQFERTAIGEHLLLGGDNLDVALMRLVEKKLNTSNLMLRQRQALQRACCVAKERLLSDANLEKIPINILGSGRALVGQMLGSELNRGELLEILTTGFIPLNAADEFPKSNRRSALRELGLPYASDPAISRHLAAFLAQASEATKSQAISTTPGSYPTLAQPQAVLFNGGFCIPEIVRERIIEGIAGWFQAKQSGWRPKLLANPDMESAVAVGAAYYGQVRRGVGLRIRAGSARTYYVGVRSEEHLQGVCVLPAGVEEGTSLPLNRKFSIVTNRPVSFGLYSSTIRHDQHGEVAVLNEAEVHRHAPLGTLLRYGKKMREFELGVRLSVNFTEMGTLELWCESLSSPHRWRLQFELRGYESQAQETAKESGQHQQPAPQLDKPSAQTMEPVIQLIQAAFGKADDPHKPAVDPETLVTRCESVLGLNRDSWPLEMIRSFSDVLLNLAAARTQSQAHERRWLNLLGFCLRPGFGAVGDESRIASARKLYMTASTTSREIQIQAEWLVFWRRVTAGLNPSQQHEFYYHLAAMLGLGKKKISGRLNRQVEREGWRVLASLEHLPASLRGSLGVQVLARLNKEPTDQTWLWCLARLGARIPLYGSLGCIVDPATAAQWLESLLELPEFLPQTAWTIVQLGARTGDERHDIEEKIRKKALATLKERGTSEELTRFLRGYEAPTRADVDRIFGEKLPVGFEVISSTNCLLNIPALIHPTKLVQAG